VLAPLGRQHGFRETGVGTWLQTGVRDVAGRIPRGNLEAMDSALQQSLEGRYLGFARQGV